MVGDPADRAAPVVDDLDGEAVGVAHDDREALDVAAVVAVGREGARALRSSTTGAAPFRRWATKNAAKVAATSATKAASAARDTVSAYGDWSAPTITTTSACTGLANELFASDCVSVSRGVTERIESALATSIAWRRSPEAYVTTDCCSAWLVLLVVWTSL